MNYQFNRGKTARQKQAAAEVSAARVLALASSLRFPGIQWISISRRRGKALTAKLATRGRERRKYFCNWNACGCGSSLKGDLEIELDLT